MVYRKNITPEVIQFFRDKLDNVTYEEICQLPCDIINKECTDGEKEKIVNCVVDYYHEKGFPFYEINDDKLYKDLRNVKNSTIDKIEVEDDELQQNMAGLYFINTFHPEMWDVPCRKAKTPMEVFNDRQTLYNAILKRIKLNSTSPLTPFQIRKSLKVFSGAQSVSNFRPTIAKYIYEKYGKENAKILDPCAGYGGRLMGAFLANNVAKYTSVDPNKVTVKNNEKLLEYLYKIENGMFENHIEKDINFYDVPFEDWVPDDTYDVIFTSPPYFNIERYSDEDTQSWVRYQTIESWLDNFIGKLIEISASCLADDGYFIINIDGGDKIKDGFLERAEKYFTLSEIKHMRLSKMLGHRKTNKAKFKLEPIYVFRKK